MKLDQTIILNGVAITPLKVVQDSRCPADVQCIWAGTVELQVSLSSGSEIANLSIKLNEPLLFAHKNITLIETSPGPHSKKIIAPADYSFGFSVTASLQ